MAGIGVISELENFLRLTNKRETVVAANMANVDTPGYRTQDFDFQRELSRAMSQPTSTAESPSPKVGLHAVSGLLERGDGNNVDLDRESMLMSETQLQYQMATQLMKQRFHQLLSAISSGGQ